MSLKETREQLIQLLTDKDNKVIALSGKWGTGKSYMWEQVKAASADPEVKSALYASLFGASSVDQIEIKLLQSSTKSAESYPVLFKSIKQTYKTAVKALEGVNSGFSALNDLGLLIAPALLKNKVLVLDDIERKHESLSIDEVLGFIDEFTKQHECRVVLILNDDQLDKREVWNTLREKVIDQELRLTTSAKEAFKIGIGIIPSPWEQQLETNVIHCGVTNIRIVCKIIKVVNRIIGERSDLGPALLARVIPSAVLLASVHYKGIEDGPTFPYILSRGSLEELEDDTTDENDKDAKKKRSSWDGLLSELGIYSCDEFELLVIEYLQSGLFNVAGLSAVIDRYIAENDALETRDRCNKLIDRSFWDYRLSEEDILAQAGPVAEKSMLIDPYMVTSVHDILVGLKDGKDLANQAVDNWIKSFNERNLEHAELDNMFGHKVHPRIVAAFDAINVAAQENTSLFEACECIVQKNGWGIRQEMAFRQATVLDFEATIRSADYKGLRMFMHKMVRISLDKAQYEVHFGSASENFILACKKIIDDKDSPRLAAVVKMVFSNSAASALLNAAE